MPLFAEINAEGWVLIVGAIATAMTSVLGTVFSFLSARRSGKAETKIGDVQDTLKQQDVTTADVKDDLLRSREASLATAKALGKKIDRVHSLVNGPHTALVADKAAALRRVADLSGDPADALVADAAERDLAARRVVEANERRAAGTSMEMPALRD